ncbi:MAG: PAS domain S-box protein [Thermodesulfobacteriota bacterium]
MSSLDAGTREGIAELGKTRDSEIVVAEYRLLFSQSRSAVVAASLSALVLVAALRDVVPVLLLSLWVTAYLLVQVPRFTVIRWYSKTPPDDAKRITKLGKSFVLLTVISGSFWGAAGVVLFPESSVAHQFLLAIFIAGIAAAATATYAARVECFFPTILAELLPPAGRFLYQRDEQSVIVGAVVFLFAWVLIMTAREMNAATRESIRLGFEKDRLIGSLTLEKTKVADLNVLLSAEIAEKSQTQAELEQARDRLEETVDARTAELSETNKKLQAEVFERIRAEELLKREKRNLVELFEAMEDGVHVVDTAFNVLYVNNSIRQDFGSPEGRKCYEYFHGFTEPCERCHMSKVLRGRPARFEWYSDRTGKTYEIIDTRLQGLDEKVRKLEILRDVTKRKKTEQALRESEARFRELADLLPQFVYEADKEGRFTFVNRSGLEKTGYGGDDLAAGMGVTDIMVPEARPRAEENIRRMMQGEYKSGNEYFMRRKDGTTLPIVAYSSPIVRDGQAVGFRGVAVDITDRVESERALRESEERYRLLTDHSLTGIYIHQDNVFVFVNERLAGMVGYEPHEMIGKPFWVFVHPADMEMVKQRGMARARGEEVIPNYEFRMTCKDGSTIWVELLAATTFLGSRWANMGNVADITERKKTQDALRESEQKYRTIVETIQDAYYELDLHGKLIFFNRRTCELLGYRPEQLVGMTYHQFMDEASAGKFVEALNRVYRTGEPTILFDYEVIRQDGARRTVELSVSLAAEPRTTPTVFYGIARDVTERKAMERHVFHLEKMQAIGTLAGGIAHDFNNILYAVMGFTELAMDEIPSGSSCHENLSHVMNAGKRAKDLVSQILAFSRQDDAKKKPVDVKAVVKESLKFLRSSIPTTIEMHSHIDGRVGNVLGDATQIHQVVMNLCTNARQAIGGNGGRLEVRLEEIEFETPVTREHTALSPGRYVKISVQDSGPGIPPQVMSRIFEPYFTTKPKGQGTGLGLSVVHGIVRSHGGAIEVASERGKGTVFRVYLPALDVSALVRDEHEARDPAGENQRVLFIDDERPIVEMGKRLLERLGYQVTTRSSGLEALELVRTKPHHFDLVITDITMPSLTGLELARGIRKVRPDIPIILCTGFSELVSDAVLRDIGIQGILMKPILRNEMARAIHEALKGPSPV